MSFEFSTISPGWYILLCLLAAAALTWLLYRKPIPASPRMKKIMMALRFTGLFLLFLLLLSPVIKYKENHEEKPLLLVFYDKSESAGAYAKQYPGLQQDLEDLSNRFDIKAFVFARDVRNAGDTGLSTGATDISAVYNHISEVYDNSNIGAALIVSDGIMNKGSNPLFKKLPKNAPVYTLGFGDTVQHPDLLVGSVLANESVYMGNEFTLEAGLQAFSLQGRTAQVTLLEDGRALQTRNILFKGNPDFERLEFVLKAGAPGTHRYSVSASPMPGEINKNNNLRSTVVQVSDNRKKVAIVYHSPHPDVSAIMRGMEKNAHYEMQKFAVSQNPDLSNFDLVVLHGVPGGNAEFNFVSKLKTMKRSLLFIVTTQTQTNLLNAIDPDIGLQTSLSDFNDVQAQLKTDFSEFNISDELKQSLRNWPPLKAPFGRIAPTGGFRSMLTQRIGNISTDMPLLGFRQEEYIRYGWLFGEGIWKWRFREYAQTKAFESFDEFISKLLQYLASEQVKNSFRTFPESPENEPDNPVILVAENYDQNLALDNSADVSAMITGEKGFSRKVQFSRNGRGYRYEAGLLPAGNYSYTATLAGAKGRTASNRFSVLEHSAESMNTRADFSLLRKLASQNKGAFYPLEQKENMLAALKTNPAMKPLIYTQTKLSEWIHIKWLFVLMIILFSTEWFLRKREGGY